MDKVENGYLVRYKATGEDLVTVVFETYEKLEKWLKKELT